MLARNYEDEDRNMELSSEQKIKLRCGIIALTNGLSNPMAYKAEDHAIFYDFLESLDGAVATPRGLWRYLGETFRDFGQILRDGIAESNEVMIRNARLEMADIRTLADLLKRAGVANVCQVSLDYLEKYPDTEDVEFTAGPRDNSNAVRENVQVEKGD